MFKTKINFKLFAPIALLAVVAFLPILSFNVKAESTIFLDKNGSTVSNGQNFSMKVLTNSSSAFNSAQVNLSFDSQKLKLISVSKGSVLPNFVDQQQRSSSIKYTMYGTPGTDAQPGNNIVLLIVNFKAIENGTAKVKLESGTRTLIAGNNVASGLGSSTLTIKTGTIDTTSSSTTPVEADENQPIASRDGVPAEQAPIDKAAEQEARKTDKTNPQFIKISQSGFIDDNISIKITSDEPTRASVKSGQSKDDLIVDSLSQGGLKGTYFVSLGTLSKSIEDQKPFYYQITITDIAGNETISEIRSISTQGITVSLTIKNPDGSLIKNREVIINGKEFKTDSNGIVKVDKLIPGSVNISIIDENGEEIFLGELTAVEGISDQVLGIISQKNIQDGSILGVNNSTYSIIIAVIGAIAVLVLLGGAKKYMSKRKQAKLHTANPYPSKMPKFNSYSSNPNPTIISPANSKDSMQNTVAASTQAQQPRPIYQAPPNSTPNPQAQEATANQQTPSSQPNKEQQVKPPTPQSPTALPGVDQAKTIVADLVNGDSNQDNK